MSDLSSTASQGITSEERAKSEWPTRGPDFNAWHENVALFAQVIQENPGLWLIDSDLKYLNLRIDTRGGEFLVTCRDGEAISADRVVKAARAARAKGYNRAYRDVATKAIEERGGGGDGT
jgi:hypothetical protein